MEWKQGAQANMANDMSAVRCGAGDLPRRRLGWKHGKHEGIARNSNNTVSFRYHPGQSGRRPIDDLWERRRKLAIVKLH